MIGLLSIIVLKVFMFVENCLSVMLMCVLFYIRVLLMKDVLVLVFIDGVVWDVGFLYFLVKSLVILLKLLVLFVSMKYFIWILFSLVDK